MSDRAPVRPNGRSTLSIAALAAAAACLAACVAALGLLAAPPGARAAQGPGMTVRIPSPQDVDNVYILAAVHDKRCKLIVTGSALGHSMSGTSKSVKQHLTNQVYLRLSRSAKRSIKKALRKGRTVRASVTIVGRDSSGARSTVTRKIKLKN